MILVLQIAAGIVLALMIVVIAPLIFSAILQVFADDRRRVEKIREENEQRKSAEEQDPSLKWKRRRQTLKTYFTALAAYLLGCFTYGRRMNEMNERVWIAIRFCLSSHPR